MTSKPNLRAQDGFTLVELLVVVLIIGVLAAIALPAFAGQRAKALDGDAKSNARNLVSQMDSCYTEHDLYDGCPGGETGIPQGSDPGEVEVRISLDGSSYKLVARSVTGNEFTVDKAADGTMTLSCSDAGDPRGGCVGGRW